MKREILYIGYGDLGKRLSNISSDQLNITGISRNRESLYQADIQIQFDIHSNASLEKLNPVILSTGIISILISYCYSM